MAEFAKLAIKGRDAETTLANSRTELDRHQLRRGAGVPTVSVLVGAVPAAISVWREWSLDRGRPVVVVASNKQRQIVGEWILQALENRDLNEAALAWLAEASGARASELAQSLAGKSLHERGLVLRPLLERTVDRDAAKLCRWILEPLLEEPPGAEQLPDALYALFAAGEHPAERGLGVMHRLMATGVTPTLLVVPPEDSATVETWIDAAAQTVIRIALEAPGLPVALAIPALDFDRYIESAVESRRVAMLRETVLRLDDLQVNAIRRNLEQSLGGMAVRAEDSICRLVRDGCSDKLARAFTAAANALLTSDGMIDSRSHEHDRRARKWDKLSLTLPDRESVNEEESDAPSARADDAARSAAERFLFERLQSLPQTQGLFELNGKLPAEFGPAGEAEVDLLGRTVRMAIEIDGYYHFQDAECYRRDRRKDVALQKLDFFVLRVLADDVVMRLGRTLDAILDAVSFRRERRGATKRSQMEDEET